MAFLSHIHAIFSVQGQRSADSVKSATFLENHLYLYRKGSNVCATFRRVHDSDDEDVYHHMKSPPKWLLSWWIFHMFYEFLEEECSVSYAEATRIRPAKQQSVL
jgi:hypothetical protein